LLSWCLCVLVVNIPALWLIFHLFLAADADFPLTPMPTGRHERSMLSTRNIMKRLSFWRNGEAILGLVFAMAGLYVAWRGLGMLREIWGQVSALLPLKPLADDIGKQIAASMPIVSSLFIRIVSSICGVLVGVAWFVSGIAETIEALGKSPAPKDLHQREVVAEILRRAELLYWRSAGMMFRWLGRTWPRMRAITPVSRVLVSNLCRSSVKVLLVGIALIILWRGLHLTPTLLKRHLDVTVSLGIPSPLPLFLVLGLILAVHVFVALSLLFARPRELERSTELVSVRGQGEVGLFFAMIEEGCKLLSSRAEPDRQPLRTEQTDGLGLRGTLIETSPTTVTAAGKPAGHVCAGLMFVLVTLGFSRLIHFSRPTASMPFQEFLTAHLLDHLLEVGFAVALIVAGMHIGEQARRLFSLRRYRSAAVFCHEVMDGDQELTSGKVPAQRTLESKRLPMSWSVIHGADDRFAGWIKDPRRRTRFRVRVYWAEVFSESADSGGERYIVTVQPSAALDRAIGRILEIPFWVGFERDGASVAPAEHGAAGAGLTAATEQKNE
jgi:hypothetical protein